MNPIEAGESEEDVKKAQKKWEEAEKSKGTSEGKTKAEKERDELLDGAKDTTERKVKSKNYEKGGGNTKAQILTIWI
ncbi:ATP synthase subunit B family protein [[Clostridium] hylemonae]|uniref:hypothetical protein n=1 Tax=[Clostridium] hylemonae TaxID=89153 RepID=UPI001FCA4CF1|nr:hypothetical protein [[Clostridium] hylemonae]BDF04426.1 hypothetical protein CE91St63_14880 [[Clostridium] hylemonae]